MDNLPNLEGKILLIYLMHSGGEHFTVIEQPRFDLQGDRLFLVGRLAPYKGGWGHGLPTAVAWDAVQQYFVFESLEQLEKELGRATGRNLAGFLNR